MPIRVGELARRTGVSESTLRAWERRFGLLEPKRTAGRQRLYDDDDVARVAAVRRLVEEGLTLPAAVARVRSAGAAAVPTGEGESLLFGQILGGIEWLAGHPPDNGRRTTSDEQRVGDPHTPQRSPVRCR